MKKRVIFIILILIIFLFIIYNFKWKYSNYVLNKEPLILSGEQKLEIIKTKYIQKNDIVLSGNAQLIIRDSYFSHEGDGAQAFGLTAYDNSSIIIENSKLKTSDWIDWFFYDNSKLVYNKSKIKVGNPWGSFWGNSSLLVLGSSFGGTIYDNTKFHIKDSPNVFIEIYVFKDQVIDESNLKPGKIDKFVFPNKGEVNINYSIIVENSNIDYWGVGLGPGGTMTLRDSRKINICMPLGNHYLNETIYFDNLRKDVIYEDRIIEYIDSRLTLKDVSTKGWCTSAHNNNTLYVSNSDIDDINHNSGNGRMYYEKVISDIAITTDNNYLEIKNSVINGDVIAKGNSTIILINTKVKGNILKKDNGRILIKS